MKSSETIGKIALALSEAQSELQNPSKDRTAMISSAKGQYKYSYANFATALDAIRPVLSKHKIGFVQTTRYDGQILWLDTTLMHESGEWVQGEYPVGSFADQRTMGSANSYARRYSLFPMIGVQGDDDDDGEADQERPPQRPAAVTIGESLLDFHLRKMREAASQTDFEECVKVARGAWGRMGGDDQKKLMAAVEARRAFWMQGPVEAK